MHFAVDTTKHITCSIPNYHVCGMHVVYLWYKCHSKKQCSLCKDGQAIQCNIYNMMAFEDKFSDNQNCDDDCIDVYNYVDFFCVI